MDPATVHPLLLIVAGTSARQLRYQCTNSEPWCCHPSLVVAAPTPGLRSLVYAQNTLANPSLSFTGARVRYLKGTVAGLGGTDMFRVGMIRSDMP